MLKCLAIIQTISSSVVALIEQEVIDGARTGRYRLNTYNGPVLIAVPFTGNVLTLTATTSTFSQEPLEVHREELADQWIAEAASMGYKLRRLDIIEEVSGRSW